MRGKREENIVGKRRKCWLPAFSPFPTMFSKVSFLSPLHHGLLGKGLKQRNQYKSTLD